MAISYNISRQEETSTNTFIRIDTDKPVHIERFIPNDKVLRDEIESMVAELEISYDAYVAPEVAVSKTQQENDTLETSIRPAKVATEKARIIQEREDKVAAEEATKEAAKATPIKPVEAIK